MNYQNSICNFKTQNPIFGTYICTLLLLDLFTGEWCNVIFPQVKFPRLYKTINLPCSLQLATSVQRLAELQVKYPLLGQSDEEKTIQQWLKIDQELHYKYHYATIQQKHWQYSIPIKFYTKLKKKKINSASWKKMKMEITNSKFLIVNWRTQNAKPQLFSTVFPVLWQRGRKKLLWTCNDTLTNQFSNASPAI